MVALFEHLPPLNVVGEAVHVSIDPPDDDWVLLADQPTARLFAQMPIPVTGAADPTSGVEVGRKRSSHLLVPPVPGQKVSRKPSGWRRAERLWQCAGEPIGAIFDVLVRP